MEGLPQSVSDEEIEAQKQFGKYWGITKGLVKRLRKTCDDPGDAMMVTCLAAATVVCFARREHGARVQALRFMALQMQQALRIVEDMLDDQVEVN